jgi:hypothetical protein
VGTWGGEATTALSNDLANNPRPRSKLWEKREAINGLSVAGDRRLMTPLIDFRRLSHDARWAVREEGDNPVGSSVEDGSRRWRL